jgi:glycosyltransferase involved in cell wall biosynthesis
MKVLLFSNLFPTSRDASRGVFVAQMAAAMASNCEVHALVPLPWVPGGVLGDRLVPDQFRDLVGISKQATWNGVPATYVRYPMVPKLSRAWHPRLMSMGALPAAVEMHRRHRFDVLNAHWLDPDGVASVSIARSLGIPVVLSARGCDVNLYLQDARRRDRILQAVHHADEVTTVSAALKEQLVGAGVAAAKITVIPNGVDTSIFFRRDREECRRALGIGHSGPLIVCVSRLSDEKGIDVLLEAFGRLAAEQRAVELALVGNGPLRAALESRAAALGIADRVRFVGAVPHEQVPVWQGAATVTCLPSLREGYPNAAMEALACGRPMVASRVGALPEMIGEGRGILVPAGDSIALSGALRQALETRWSEEAIAESVAGAGWDATAQGYRRVCEAAVDAVSLRQGSPAQGKAA